jgi:hypothetical protein
LGNLKRREDNIKIVFKEIVCDCVDGVHMVVLRAVVNTGSVYGGEVRDQLSNYQLVNKDIVLRSWWFFILR